MPLSRRSHVIRQRPASNLYHSSRIAEAKGFGMTHLVTINFSMVDHPPEKVSESFRWVRARWADWMRRPSRKSSHTPTAPHDVWSIEGAGGVTAVHWMMHLPPDRIEDCTRRIGAWVEKVAGVAVPSGAIDVKPVHNARGLTRYMLKGIDPVFAASYGVRAEDQGLVIGKRSGYSRKLGPTVKKQMREAGTYPQAGGWATRQAQKAKHRARPS